jgi:hypothetical protein
MHLVNANELKFNGSAFPYPSHSESQQADPGVKYFMLLEFRCTCAPYTSELHCLSFLDYYKLCSSVKKMHISVRALEIL